MDQIKIGRFIAGQRHELGLTQAELGSRLGMTDKSVSKWERGDGLPQADSLIALMQLYDVSNI